MLQTYIKLQTKIFIFLRNIYRYIYYITLILYYYIRIISTLFHYLSYLPSGVFMGEGGSTLPRI